jgi:flavin reductase (DIM6/NTAB) family NADH-FMN oxidoreductase RutF
MNVSLNELSPEITYKLLAGLVIPRPIAWISTRGENGIANCAPFSFFNLVSAHPPMCAIGINARSTGESKDTIVNIRRNGEFVLNLVDEANARRMQITGEEFPADVSEFDRAALTPVPSVRVIQPRILEAAASFECVVERILRIHDRQDIVIADIVHLHARDGIVDEDTYRVSEHGYTPIGRLYGNQYCTIRDRFELRGDTREKSGG